MHLNLFGRRRASEKPVLNAHSKTKSPTHRQNEKQFTIDTLAKMRETIKNLEKRENFLSVKANAQLEEALEKNKAGDKKGAATAMSRKKLYDTEVLKILQMKTNLEAQMLSIESANVALVANEGMQAGLSAQREVSRYVNVEEVAQMHEEIEEHLINADEASRILAGSYNVGDVFDEDALLAELEQEMKGDKATKQVFRVKSEREEVDDLAKLMETLPTIPVENTLPEAPKTQVMLAHQDSLADLLKLQEEMGL